MGELAHQRCAVVVNSGGELFEQRDNALVVDAELIARSLRFRGDRGPAAEHDKTDAAAGFLFGVALVAVRRQPAFSIATVVGGADLPVADCELPDGDRLQQRLEIYLWLGVRHTHPRLTALPQCDISNCFSILSMTAGARSMAWAGRGTKHRGRSRLPAGRPQAAAAAMVSRLATRASRARNPISRNS
jgi:hypothetical protein